MNWDAFGAWGEWLGAVAVIATLFYLARQIQQQNKIARFNALADLFEGINGPNSLLASNTELRNILLKGLDDPESLNDEESSAFSLKFPVLQRVL